MVIGIGRSPEHCEEAARRIRRSLQSPTSAQGAIRFVHADLSSLTEVRTAASAVSAILAEHGYQYLDVLINNAAAVPSRRTVTVDGYELQWTVNHLAPFLLSHQLLPLLARSDDARILTVSSRSHRIGRIRLKDPNLASGYNLLKAYSQSKLANVLFTSHFNRRLSARTGIRAFAVDPGLVRTEIGHKHTRGLAHWIWSLRQRAGVSPAEGAATSVYLATAPQSDLNAAEYWRDCRPLPSSKRSYDPKLAEELWRLSESMCAVSYSRYESQEALRQQPIEPQG